MAYNLLDLRTRVRAKIKDSSYAATTVDGFINDAMVEVSDLMLVKQLQKVTDQSLTIGEHTVAQQSDHQTTRRLVIIDPVSTTSYRDLTKYRKDTDSFFALYPVPDALDNSQPAYWTEYGNQIYFNCPVNKAYVLRQFYQKLPTELEVDSDVPELPRNYREVIVLGAAYRCEEERGNFDIAAVLQNRFNDRIGDLMMRFANDSLTSPDTVVMPGRRVE